MNTTCCGAELHRFVGGREILLFIEVQPAEAKQRVEPEASRLGHVEHTVTGGSLQFALIVKVVVRDERTVQSAGNIEDVARAGNRRFGRACLPSKLR